MQEYNPQGRRRPMRGAKPKRRFWGILTLDDLPKDNEKYRLLIAQLQSQYGAAKELRRAKPDEWSI